MSIHAAALLSITALICTGLLILCRPIPAPALPPAPPQIIILTDPGSRAAPPPQQRLIPPAPAPSKPKKPIGKAV